MIISLAKKAISVTLRPENLLWLEGERRASSQRSVSEALDALIARARAGRHGRSEPVKSVVDSIEIAADDPQLTRADLAILGLFARRGAPRRLRRGRHLSPAAA